MRGAPPPVTIDIIDIYDLYLLRVDGPEPTPARQPETPVVDGGLKQDLVYANP